MVVAIVRLLLISLISLPLWAADNTVEVRTKGSGTEILVDQIGSGNTARVWCGLSEGTFDTHLCTNADIDIDQTGDGNLAKAYSQFTNHSNNEYTIQQEGDNNTAYLDLDYSNNVTTITQIGNDDYAEIYMGGDNNNYIISQTGDDFYAKMYAFGDYSDWTITQSGTGNHNAYIKSCGNCNNNDATITQSGSGAKDGDIEFRNNPSDNNTVNLTQSGSGLHVGNILVKQGSYTVNATQSGSTNQNYTVTLDCTGTCDKTITINQY